MNVKIHGIWILLLFTSAATGQKKIILGNAQVPTVLIRQYTQPVDTANFIEQVRWASVLDFGARETTVGEAFDSWQAFQDCENATNVDRCYVPDDGNPSTYYRISQKVTIDQPKEFVGILGKRLGAKSRVVVDTNNTAFHIMQGAGAHAVTIKKLSIEGWAVSDDTTAHGIILNTAADIFDNEVSRHGGDGIHASGDNTQGTNVNQARIIGNICMSNHLNGIRVGDLDGNVVHLEDNDVRSNGRWGIINDGFLDFVALNCHAVNNGLGQPYGKGGPFTTTNPNCKAVWINCYSEGGQNLEVHEQHTIILGGQKGSGVSTENGPFYLSRNGFGGWELPSIVNRFISGNNIFYYKSGGTNHWDLQVSRDSTIDHYGYGWQELQRTVTFSDDKIRYLSSESPDVLGWGSPNDLYLPYGFHVGQGSGTNSQHVTILGGSTLPATCTVGQWFFHSSTTSLTAAISRCTATNTWTTILTNM